MKNYVITKNYKKAFRRLIICFVILAVISAVGIPLSLSQQIHDASVLKQQAALASPDPTNNTDDHHHDEHNDEAWKSQITPLTAMNYVIIGAAILLMGVWAILYWLTVVARLYKSAAVAGTRITQPREVARRAYDRDDQLHHHVPVFCVLCLPVRVYSAGVAACTKTANTETGSGSHICSSDCGP